MSKIQLGDSYGKEKSKYNKRNNLPSDVKEQGEADTPLGQSLTERTVSNTTMLYRGLERSRTLQVLLSVIWKLSGDKALPFQFHGQIHHTRQADNHSLHNNFFRTNRQTKRFPFPMSFH